ncbi:MAG: hypothetical protein R3F17_06530 [Planctomycetota bacterium]
MFSVITAKRDLYLLPLYPAGALIAAEGLARLTRRERLPRALPYLLVAPLGILTLAAAAAGPLAVRSDERLAGLTAYVLPAPSFLVLAPRSCCDAAPRPAPNSCPGPPASPSSGRPD